MPYPRIRQMNESVSQLLGFFERHARWVVLTGAGISADSGIPTYRDGNGRWLRNTPIQHQEFVADASARQRYWGRSMVGWPGVRDALPNDNHRALAAMEAMGRVELTITQNVDRLHQRAGSQRVTDLHGRLDRVLCLDCGAGYEREEVQRELESLNPHHQGLVAAARPDGDADLSPKQVNDIHVWDCPACCGLLKPDVVFFGGSIPRQRVQQCEQALESADGLLVLGSSLQVFSGFRFCKMAVAQNKPLVILNEGLTRADGLADLKVSDQALDLFRKSIQTLGTLTPSPLEKQTRHG